MIDSFHMYEFLYTKIQNKKPPYHTPSPLVKKYPIKNNSMQKASFSICNV
jgi:hypothetical protein